LRFLDGDEEIVEGVEVLLTPGHTAGGQSVAVQTNSGVAVITGFCCGRQNFVVPPELAGLATFLAPGQFMDLPQAVDSVLKVKEMANVVVPIHAEDYLSGDPIS
jgi:N-acyl homoserine lactone hydrolase